MDRKRLIVLYDGTWNTPLDQTNVQRLRELIYDRDGEMAQLRFYDRGVGTSKSLPRNLLEGLTGLGLTDNLRQGYEWLSEHYQGCGKLCDSSCLKCCDEIWIFGFSRGAYTARSLAGMIRQCGLVSSPTPERIQRALELYQNKKLLPDDPVCVRFREAHCHQPRIRFVGVWDTVGSLGIPGTHYSESGKFSWHDTELSSRVDYAYQALALDEQRPNFKAILWTSDNGEPHEQNLGVEQRWFVGAHSNVGGGYDQDALPERVERDHLPEISLAWMLEKAKLPDGSGLKTAPFTPVAKAWRSDPVDSYTDFACGLYFIARCLLTLGRGKRHTRLYSSMTCPAPKKLKQILLRPIKYDKAEASELHRVVNVTLDDSVRCKIQEAVAKSAYAPKVLIQSEKRYPLGLLEVDTGKERDCSLCAMGRVLRKVPELLLKYMRKPASTPMGKA